MIIYNFYFNSNVLAWYRTIRTCSLVTSKIVSDTNIELKTAKPKRVRKKLISSELNQYLDSDEQMKELKHLLPHKLFQLKLSQPEALYAIDSTVAKTFVAKIKNKLLFPKNSLVMEINPGLGVLTKELVNCGVKNLESYESMVHFFNYLKVQNVNVRMGDLLSIWKLAHQDRFDNGNRVANLLSSVTKNPWSNDSLMKIVGAVPNANFIKHLIFAIIFQTSIALYGRPELFVALPPAVYNSFTCHSSAGYMSYRASSVLFQVFFEWDLLLTLPRSAFLPWEAKKNKNKKNDTITSDHLNSIYLVRIIPKKNLPVSQDQLKAFWYFVKHNMISRSARVIPQLERWIPGCGAKIIAHSSKSSSSLKNIGIFTEFGELSPEQILNLFEIFVSFPEYNDSPFLASMENRLLKMETSNDLISSLDIDGDPSGNSLEEQPSTEENVKAN